MSTFSPDDTPVGSSFSADDQPVEAVQPTSVSLGGRIASVGSGINALGGPVDVLMNPANAFSRAKGAYESSMAAEAKPVTSEGVTSLGEAARNIDLGIAQPFGGARLFTQPGDENPTLGQQILRFGGNAAGMTAAIFGAEPLALGARGLQAVEGTAAPYVNKAGQQIAALGEPAATALGRAAQNMGPAARSLVVDSVEAAVRNPAKFFGMEAASAAGAGIGTEAGGEMTGGSPEGKALGGIIGGVLAPFAAAYEKVAPIWQAAKSSARALFAGTERQATQQALEGAAQRLQSVVPNPSGVAAKLTGPSEVGATAGQQTGEPGLLSIEKSILQKSDAIGQAATEQHFQDVNSVIREKVGATAGEDADPEHMRSYLDSLTQERLKQAATASDQKLADLGPTATREDASRIWKSELTSAESAAKDQEGQLWRAAPLQNEGRVSETAAEYQDFLNGLKRSRVSEADAQKYLPNTVKEFLGYTGEEGQFVPGSFITKNPTLGELKDLRSRLLYLKRDLNAKDVPNAQESAFVNPLIGRLQAALLRDMHNVSPGDPALDTAIAYTKDLHTRFHQGNVGKVLGWEREGGPSVPAEQTLESTLLQPGMKGVTATDQLLAAVKDSPNLGQMKGHLEDVLSDRFLHAANTDGEFNPKKAADFLQSDQMRFVMSRFPELQARFQSAINSGKEAAVVEGLVNPKQSIAAAMIHAPPGDEFTKLAATRDLPAVKAKMDDLVTTLSGDPRALDGGREAFVQWLLKKAEIPGERGMATTGEQMISGVKLKKLLSDPVVNAISTKIMSPRQKDRIAQLADAAFKMDLAKNAPAAAGVVNAEEGMWSETARQVIAGSIGRHLAGVMAHTPLKAAPIQTPSIIIKLSNRLQRSLMDPTRKVIVDALMSKDPALLKSLLTMPIKGNGNPIIDKQLNAWLYNTAGQYGLNVYEANKEDLKSQMNNMVNEAVGNGQTD